MTTILIVSYERKIGEKYLLQTLEKPLQEIAILLEHCEINLEKVKELNPSYSPEQIREALNWNTRNLESSCLLLFEAIFSSKETIPPRIMALCSYIDHCVKETQNQEKNISKKFELMKTKVDLGDPLFGSTDIGKLFNDGENRDITKSTDNILATKPEFMQSNSDL